MEHVMLPAEPLHEPIRFRVVCNSKYERGDWFSWPEKHNFLLSGELDGVFAISKRCGEKIVEVEDDDEQAEFLQTWLWFGVLLEMVDDVDVARFQRRDEDGNVWLTTSHLDVLTKEWIAWVCEQDWAYDETLLGEWGGSRYLKIKKARVVVIRYLETYVNPQELLGDVCLSIALLCQHFNKALFRIYFATGVLDAWNMVSELNWRNVDSACAMRIVKQMQDDGWCPSDIAGFGLYDVYICTLWFYANLKARNNTVSHKSCSDEVCYHMQMNLDKYKPVHNDPECDCVLLGPDPDALVGVIMDEKLPLLRVLLKDEEKRLSINIEPRTERSPFVAISHVWADGHGNPASNLLPTCFLRQLQSMADQVIPTRAGEHALFWMDTLCIPREPRSARNLALKRLRDPYDYGTHVLVLDAYLQTLHAKGRSFIELLAVINVSNWAKRLWTFQEGRLANKIWFQFSDCLINLDEESEIWMKLPPDLRWPTDMASYIVTSHTSTNVIPSGWQMDRPENDSIFDIREGVRLRSTSVATDEALCISSIAGLDMSEILDTPEERRLERFWSLFPGIPTSIVLSKASQKLNSKGFRWAPASFMSDPHNNRWIGPRSSDYKSHGRWSPAGLIVELPYIEFTSTVAFGHKNFLDALYKFPWGNPKVSRTPARSTMAMFLQNSNGYWIACDFEEEWHQETAAISLDERPAIVIEQPVNQVAYSTPTHTSNGDAIAAAFVSHGTKPLEDGTIQARFLRHCSLYFLSEKECLFHQEADLIANQLFRDHWDKPNEICSDLESVYDFVEPLVPAHVLGEPCMEIGREALKVSTSKVWVSDEDVMKNVVNMVATLCSIGPWRDVEEAAKPTKWCVD